MNFEGEILRELSDLGVPRAHTWALKKYLQYLKISDKIK